MTILWTVIRRTDVPKFGLTQPTEVREFVSLELAEEKLGTMFPTREEAQARLDRMLLPGHTGKSTLGFDTKLSVEAVTILT